jgi:hypothetical protein
MSARARSSWAASSSTSGGGGDDPHAAAVAPSSAKAANNTRRLLTVGGGLGTCNILPLPVRRQRGDKPRVQRCDKPRVVSTPAALCIRWTPPRVCRLARRRWRIVDSRFQVAPRESCPDNSR